MMSNAVTILGVNPTVADISDCLMCEATLPGDSPTMTLEAQGAVFKIRVCEACTQKAIFAAAPDDLAQWQADLFRRLELVSDELLRNAQAMTPNSQETAQ
jgi:hypothetical protein